MNEEHLLEKRATTLSEEFLRPTITHLNYQGYFFFFKACEV